MQLANNVLILVSLLLWFHDANTKVLRVQTRLVRHAGITKKHERKLEELSSIINKSGSADNRDGFNSLHDYSLQVSYHGNKSFSQSTLSEIVKRDNIGEISDVHRDLQAIILVIGFVLVVGYVILVLTYLSPAPTPSRPSAAPSLTLTLPPTDAGTPPPTGTPAPTKTPIMSPTESPTIEPDPTVLGLLPVFLDYARFVLFGLSIISLISVFGIVLIWGGACTIFWISMYV